MSSLPVSIERLLEAGETRQTNPQSQPPAETNPSLDPATSDIANKVANMTREVSSSRTTSPPTVSSRLRTLPPNVSLDPVKPHTLPAFQRLNSLLLPIPYPKNFYTETLTDEVTASVTLLAIWHDRPTDTGTVVGGVRCKLLSPPPSSPRLPSPPPSSSPSESMEKWWEQQRQVPPILYISTLAVLAPYRRHNIATHLLLTLLVRAVADYGIEEVQAHVWEANEEALAWYEARGFVRVEFEDQYYRRLQPGGAWRIVKEVTEADFW
ncbi:hypothetical protein EV356DRAFT_529829 [Viridothelium virens]|uniref:N-acetyltransferase domain-containing protein n=1 Tax=Viridothelium virens TaxID=1048519 RepID=A0A6A6HIG1_VIRVR|nr:hypothetical protein EV356DRAFT_529829 [Viridothelium virens]